MSESEQSKTPIIRDDEKGNVDNTIAPSKKETKVPPAKIMPGKKNVEKKEKPKTKAELAEEAQRQLEKDKAFITLMLEKDTDLTISEIKAKFPDVNSQVISGLKSHVLTLKRARNAVKKEDSLGSNEGDAELETGGTQADARLKKAQNTIDPRVVAQAFAGLGLSKSLANQVANELAKLPAQANTAPFTKKPEEGTGNGEDDGEEDPPGKEAPKAPKVDEDAPITQKQFMEFLSEQRKLQGVKGGILARPDAADSQVDAETVRIDIGSAINRSIWFTPKSLLLFDISKENGYEGDLSAFLNDCISKLFEKKNLKVGFMNLREM